MYKWLKFILLLDGVGYTSLRHAVIPGINPANVVAVLGWNCDPNSVDNWGDSILCWALKGTLSSVRALLEYVVSTAGDDLNIQEANLSEQRPYPNSTAGKSTSCFRSFALPYSIENVDVNAIQVAHGTSPLDKAMHGSIKEQQPR